MTAAWRKVIGDFWRERARTALVVLAIALGIAGFAAVLGSYAILTRELNAGYLATNPASATLFTDSVDDALLRAVVRSPGVGDAEARRTLTGRIQAGTARVRSLVLFVVQDFGNIRVSRLNPEKGAWPPAAGEILIERDALQVLGARIGDSATVKTLDGKERTLRVAGSVHDVGQAQARMENLVYGYVAVETLPLLGEKPYLDRLKLLVAENRFDEKHVRSVTADVKALLESQGHPVRRVDVPAPGKHPHAAIMGLLLLAMAGFGIFVLLLSGFLVVNLLTAMMASEVRQIGVMKAVGGTRAQIARIYFGQALLLGLAAICVALPMGVLGSRVLCRYMAGFLNFDMTSFAVPAWVYALVAVVGLALPLLAAAYPVWKGSGVSVREALADFGASANTFGTSRFDRALAGMGGAARPVLLAMRNSFRRRTRLALTVMTLTAGGVFFLSALNVRASMMQTLDRLFRTKKFDMTVSLGSMVPFETVERAIRRTPGVRRAEGWITTEGSLSGPAGDRFTVIALPPRSDFLALDIAEGRDLEPDETDAVVVNAALAAKGPRMHVGQMVTFRMGPAETTWRVVGIAREPFSPPLAYVPRDFLDRYGHKGMTNSIRLDLEKSDPASLDAVKASLDRGLEEEGIKTLGLLSKTDSRVGFDQHMVMIYVFLIVMSCILGCVGGLGLMTTMNLNVLERRREMGVMRAIGATPGTVRLIVVAEGVVIGLVSWVLAALAAWPVSKGLGDLLVMVMFRGGLDFSFEMRGLLIWLAVSILLATIGSFVPAWHASRSTVREALAYE
jgi:putative ABC transport system permease protein